MKNKFYVLTMILVLLSVAGYSQLFNTEDKAVFKEKKSGFYEQVIMPSVRCPEAAPVYYYLSMDFKDAYPVNISDYEHLWHVIPKSQGNTGTCWCFAATSFLESEIFRQKRKAVDLSEMYFVYWEYVDRARDFVETRGETYFEQGSEANALKRLIPVYGCVPDDVYTGLPDFREYHSHTEMLQEMKSFLTGVKQRGEWNEKSVIQGIRSILDSHMGKIPEQFEYNGKVFTPLSFYESLDVNVSDMFSFMSTMSKPYNQKAELVEADNWWHSDDYYNVELDNYCSVIQTALTGGYTVCICGDVSEPGYDSKMEVAIVPDFDVPSDFINENSRELRLNNGSTTDDHCIHLVGFQKVNNQMWYLVKDSGSGGFDGENKGYRFYHEDYIRLKMMNIMVNKSAARNILDNIIK